MTDKKISVAGITVPTAEKENHTDVSINQLSTKIKSENALEIGQ